MEYVMQTKLTLRLEQELIETAKAYAAASGKSVSQLVADYFTQFKAPLPKTASKTPITDSLRGAFKPKPGQPYIDKQDIRADYTDYLADKRA
jgi:Family of unknown function (DUF6364)